MSDIRFSCPKCGQHLACEPIMLGKPIGCPACKQPITIVTEKILQAYGLLELGTVALLDEVRQAHRERSKLWHPDRFPDDPRSQQLAAQKTRELDEALETVTGYFTGKRPEPRPAPRKAPEESRLEKPPQRSTAEPSAAPRSTQSPAIGLQKSRAWLLWVVLGIGLTLLIAAGVGLTVKLLQQRGAPLTNESTIAQWAKANEFHRQTYCRAILVQLSQDGSLRRYGVRLNEDVIYDHLDSTSRQQKPEDMDRKLVELCQTLVEGLARGKVAPSGRK